MKRCSKCKIEKDEKEFSKDKTAEDGRQRQCKKCNQEYRLENKEYISKCKSEYNKIIKNRPKIKIISKICSRCKNEKNINEFYKDNSRKDGLSSQCRGCIKEYNSKFEKKEYRKKYRKEYNSRPETKAHRKEYYKKYYLDPEIKQHKKEYDKEYGLRPEIKQHRKEYKKEHDAERKAYQREYDANPKNKQHRKEYNKEYDKNNPDKQSDKKARRRSLEVRASTIKFTKEQYDQRMSMFNYCCAYCGGAFEHLDHVIPLSRGGLHILANLRPSCAHCNCSKGAKLLREWLNK